MIAVIKKLIAKIKGIDPFYSEIKKSQVKLYQRYFERILDEVHLINLSNRCFSQEFDKKLAERDDRIMQQIIIEEAQKQDDLLPVYFQVILDQYICADIWKREKDKSNWVNRVIHRKGVEYFPDPTSIYKKLFE